MMKFFYNILILFIVLVTIFTANYFIESYLFVSKYYDIEYISRNCNKIKQKKIDNIENHITYDRSIAGAIYIFDHDPGQTTADDFIAARRGPVSHVTCFPSLGCVFPPTVSKECG